MPPSLLAEHGNRYSSQKVLAVQFIYIKRGEIYYHAEVRALATLNYTSGSVLKENSTFLPNPVAIFFNNKKAVNRLVFRLCLGKKRHFFLSSFPSEPTQLLIILFPQGFAAESVSGLDGSWDFMKPSASTRKRMSMDTLIDTSVDV